MSDDNKQDLKGKDETLNLTEKELEEYKTYLKFKEKFETQDESQDTTDEASESVKEEVHTTDMFDYENFSFTEETLEQIWYKKYFKKPFDAELINSYTSNSYTRNSGLNLIIMIFSTPVFYYSSRNWNGGIWVVIKVTMAIVIMWGVRMGIENILNEKSAQHNILKIRQYNNVVNNKSWVQVPSNSKDFNKYYDIAKDIIKNKLKLSYKDPQFKRDKYTEVYKISGTNLVVVFGIYNLINDGKEYNLAFMIILENDEYFLNVMGKRILSIKR